MSKTRDLVLAAVKQGVSDPKAIATWAGIELAEVRIELKRLTRAGLVRRKNLGGYAASRPDVALEKVFVQTGKMS